MSSWSTIDRTDAGRLAAALGRGDAEALAQIYDAFGAGLYDFCHTMLRDRESAADALHDALITAMGHAGRLADPMLLRGWLYALARAECVRIRQAPDRPSERLEAPESRTEGLSEAQRERLAETRRLAHSALAGLTGQQREALDLTARHELNTDELAGVLGITPRQSAELARQARRRLDTTLFAALAAAARRTECAELAGLVESWPLSPAACNRVVRHVEGCPSCDEYQPKEISINRLLQVLPVAAVPDVLRAQVLGTATAPEYQADRAAIAGRAGPFDESGWPLPPHPPAPARRRKNPVRPLLIGAAVLMMLVAAGLFMLLPGGPVKRQNTADGGGETTTDPATPGGSVSPGDSMYPISPTGPQPTPTTPTPTLSTPSASATPTASLPNTRPTQRPRPPAPPPAPPKPGTLAVSGCSMAAGSRSCTITVTARGGPVSWSVTGTSSSSLHASGGGSLARGQSAGVTVTRSGWCLGTGNGSVSFSPNGAASVSYVC